MIKNFILEQTSIPLLSKSLDVYSMRQKTIASNLANIGTMGYKRKTVEFEEKLQAQLQKQLGGKRTDNRHMALGQQRVNEIQPEITEDNSDALNSGINNVDVDKEIVAQAKNEIRYMYASRLVSGKLSGLRASIKGHFDR